MSVTYGSTGSAANGVNTCAAFYPSGINASTSKIFALVTGGHGSNLGTDFAAPSGWTQIGQAINAGGVLRRMAFFKKDTTTGSESGSVTFGFTGAPGTDGVNNAISATIFRVETQPGYTITTQFASGQDSTSNTSWAPLPDNTLSFAPNRLMLAGSCMKPATSGVDVGPNTPGFSATGQTFSGVTNVTFGRNTAAVSNSQTTYVLVRGVVATGSTTNAPNYTTTLNNNAVGVTGYLLLDEQAPVNTAPDITGTPATKVQVGQTYSFTPMTTDPDVPSLQTLTYSIMNKPSWATFSTSTGALTGTPSKSDAGVYSNIQISVTDGTDSDSLPSFSIEVLPIIVKMFVGGQRFIVAGRLELN